MPFATDDEIIIAHDVLLRGEKPFDEPRLNIIKEDSSCYIQAAPGSGKTTTLLTKLIILANKMPLPEGKGVCVLTHTNVAIDEIKAKLGPKADVLFKYPNFFGTIQTFLHKYVASAALHFFYGVQMTYVDDEIAKAVMLKKYLSLPFENKLRKFIYARTASKKHPISKDEINELGGVELLTEANVIKNVGKRIIKYDFQLRKYDLNSLPFKSRSAINKKKKKIIDIEGKEIILSFKVDWTNKKINVDKSKKIGFSTDAGCEYIRIKEEMYKEGILSFDDAYDLAFRYIHEKDLNFREFSDKRFQYLFVDEVQDCNNQQVELINNIFADNKVIVQRFGDYCQAIFDGDMDEGPDNNELKGDHAKYIHNSNRFGQRIALPLKTLCVENNQLLEGNPEIPSAKPIIITYEDPLSVLPMYERLLSSTLIPEMDNMSILDISKKERQEDPLHRINVKACGWVGKKNPDEHKRHIASYFPKFEKSNVKTRIDGESFNDFISKNSLGTVKDYANSIIQGILKFLDLCNVKNSDKRFNRTSLLAFLSTVEKKDEFLNNVMNWALSFTVSNEGDFHNLKKVVYQYLSESLLPLFDRGVTNEANAFLSAVSEVIDEPDIEKDNIFYGNNIDIEVCTVHAIKGETHCATLYLETSYGGFHESERLSNQFKGIPYTGSDKNMLKSLKVAYVGMSRARYLLCVAIQKNRFCTMDCPELREIWDVVECH